VKLIVRTWQRSPAASEHPRAPESTPATAAETHARTSDRSFDTLQASDVGKFKKELLHGADEEAVVKPRRVRT